MSGLARRRRVPHSPTRTGTSRPVSLLAPSPSDYPSLHAVAALVRSVLVAVICAILFGLGRDIDSTLYALAAALLATSGAVLFACRRDRPSTVFSLAAITLEILFLIELMRAWRAAQLGDPQWLFMLLYIPVLVAALLHGPAGAVYASALAILTFLVRFGESDTQRRLLLVDMWLTHFVPLVVLTVLLGYLVAIAERERRRRTARDEEVLRQAEALSLAREFHRATRPELASGIPGVEVVVRQENADTAFGGGDFCSIVALEDGRYAIGVADVAGKTLAGLASVPLAYAAFWVAVHHHDSPEECAEVIHRLLLGATEPDVFVAFFVAYYEPSSGRLRWCNAGQPDGLLLTREGTRWLREGGPATGAAPLSAGQAYEAAEAVVAPGDLLAVGSDGALTDQSRARLEAGREAALAELADAVLAAAAHEDDRALVLLRRL